MPCNCLDSRSRRIMYKNGTMVFALEIRVIFTIPGLLRNIWILGNLTAIGLIPAPIR